MTRLENYMKEYGAQMNTLKRRENKMLSEIEKALNSTLMVTS